MSTREDIAAALEAAFDDGDVDVHAFPIEQPPTVRPAIVVAPRKVTNAGRACPARVYGFDVLVIAHKAMQPAAEQLLDELLPLVVAALDGTPRVGWTDAERVLFMETHHAWRVAVEREDA